MADIKNFDTIQSSDRGHVGAGGEWMIYDTKYKKYRLAMPTGTLPAVEGTQDSVEVPVLTSRYKGKIPGQISLDAKEFTFMYNRDDLLRLKEIKSQGVVDFLNMHPDRTGRRYRGSVSYRENDANPGDEFTGTATITPTWIADEPTINVMDMVIPTNFITSLINEDTEVSANGSYTYPLTATSATTTYTVTSDNSAITATVSGNELKITAGASATSGSTALVKIVASASGYADWFVTTLVYVK